MFGLCLGVLLLLPAWTLLLWWLQEGIVFVVGFTALLVAALILRSYPRIQVSRAADGLRTACGRCGYNLRGNQSGVCPECGTHTAPVLAPPAQPARRPAANETAAPDPRRH